MNTSVYTGTLMAKEYPDAMTKSMPVKPVSVKKKEGFLYKRGHFKRWSKRFLLCDHNFLKTAHDQQGKNMRIYDLNDYSLTWQGQHKDKFAFGFKLREGLKRKVKELILASSDEGLAKDWFKFFLSVADAPKTSLTKQIQPEDDEDITRGRSFGIKLKEAPAVIQSQEEFPDIVVMSKRRSISLGGKNQPATEDPSQAQDSIMVTESDFTAQLDISTGHPELSSNSQPPNPFTASKSTAVLSDITSSPSLMEKVEASLEKIEKIEKLEKLEKKPEKKVVPKPIEFSLPKDAPKWVEQLFDEYVKGNQIWKSLLNEKFDKEAWNPIQDTDELRIMQSYRTTTVFKGIYKLEKGISAEKVLQVLLDVQNKHKWDTSFGKAAVLSYMPSTKQCVIHQVNKPFGMFYFPREFVYSRYVCKTLDTYFIIDQSLNDTNQVPKSLRCPRGHIEYSIMHISKIEDQVYLRILLNITNGGILTSTQDTQITLHSLMNLPNLPSICDQYEEWDDFDLAFMPTSDYLNHRESIAMDMRISVSKVAHQNQQSEEETKSQEPASVEQGKDTEEHTEEVVKLQNPLEYSNIVNELERASIGMKGGLEEESKVEEELIGMMDAAPKIQAHPLTEETLFSLLDKVKSKILASECVDKKFPKRALTQEQITAIIPDSENEVLNGKTWVKDPSAGLRFTDEDFLNKQKKVLGHFLKSMGKNLLEGKSIMSVSLPVTIFSAESMLQRAAGSFAYAPCLLPTAGQQLNPIEAFKYVIAFYFSTLHTAITQSKPFNPILGETYQGYLNGIPILCEQIFHHPPISALFMKTDDFFLHGNQHLDASLGPNSATAVHKQRLCVTLQKLGMDVYAYFPIASVSGTTFGKRYFNWSKKMKVYEPKYNLYCELHFNPDDKGVISNLFSKKTIDADKAIGSIYRVKPEFMAVMHKKEGSLNTDPRAKFNPKEHMVEEVCQIEGSWINYLEIQGKRIWDNEKMKPYKLVDQPNKALCSDSSFREDLIFMKIGDLNKAQDAKDRLENVQRADKKLREKNNPSKSKH